MATAGTLLLMDPAFGTTPKTFLGSSFITGPFGTRKVVRVSTNNWSINNGANGLFGPTGAHGGAINYRNALKKYQGTVADPTITLCWSRGGSIAMKTIREWSAWLNTEGVNPAHHKIYMAGNPDAKFIGASYLYPLVDLPAYPGNKAHSWNLFTGMCPTPVEFHGGYGAGFGLPVVMTWAPEIVIVCQEFDGWGDAPIGTNDELARFHSKGQLFCASRASGGPHGMYKTAITDPSNVTYTDPAQTNVKYTWLRTYPMPSLAKSKESPNWIRNEYERIYPIILPCYSNRPVNLPMLEAA